MRQTPPGGIMAVVANPLEKTRLARRRSKAAGVFFLERVMNLSENRVEMRIQQSAWFPRDFRFPHS
jgi:hypothetical protein